MMTDRHGAHGTDAEEADMSTDSELFSDLMLYHHEEAGVELQKKNLAHLKDRILARIGKLERVQCRGFKVVASFSAGSPGKEITADMVGQIINAKSPSRQFRVKVWSMGVNADA